MTRSLRDGHVVYALLIAPERDQQALAPAFTRMVRSLEIHGENLVSPLERRVYVGEHVLGAKLREQTRALEHL